MKTKLVLLGLYLASCIPIHADSIKLISSDQNITFTGLGAAHPNQLLVSFGTCGTGGCTLTGNFTGTGMFAPGGTYALSTSAPIVFTCTSVCTDPDFFGFKLKIGDTTFSFDFTHGEIRADGKVLLKWAFPSEPEFRGASPTGGVIALLGTTNSLTGPITAVPEPTSGLLFGTGLGTLGYLVKSRRLAR